MPHQCVRCNAFYEDGAQEILKGCTCGGRMFFYIKKNKLDEMKNMSVDLSRSESREIENDIYDLVGKRSPDDQPVVLDIESIRVLKPGKYELDIVHLFKGDPLVFKIEDGKYMIDVAQSFKNSKKEK